jgi:putative oxidoreductase
MNFNPARFAPYLQSVLRIVAALIFIPHGTQKLFYIPNAPHPPLPMFSQIWFAGVLECFGGTLMLLGLFSRPVAFLLAGEMAVAYFQEHFPHGPLPILNEGELAVLFCFIWLYFAAAGGGPWSLDAIVRRRR